MCFWTGACQRANCFYKINQIAYQRDDLVANKRKGNGTETESSSTLIIAQVVASYGS